MWATISAIIGVGGGIALLAFIVFAFRQGLQVKPDQDRKIEDWRRINGGGAGGGG
jgi:hypothetical protein